MEETKTIIISSAGILTMLFENSNNILALIIGILTIIYISIGISKRRLEKQLIKKQLLKNE